jgi:alcohol dehydrogenase class IV
MSMQRYYQPTETITGVGCLEQLGSVCRRYGERALLVCGTGAMKRSGVLERARASLVRDAVAPKTYDRVTGEPTLDIVEGGIALARQEASEVIIGLGGGSAMDTAKAIAGLLPLPGRARDYHQGRSIEKAGIPFVAIPTTAGTGAEVTKNAVLIDADRGIKSSIRHDSWFARAALVDPGLTLSLPPALTASTGADALCQAIEPYVSIAAMPATDALAAEAIRLLGRSLVRAFQNGHDIQARADTLYGSMMAGMALANARLGGVHGMAHPLGCRYHIPHGTICGLLLRYVMKYNLAYATDKYANVAHFLGANVQGMTPERAALESVTAVQRIFDALNIPQKLAPFGVREEDFPGIIAESLPSGSLKHNPRPLAEDDVRTILKEAL